IAIEPLNRYEAYLVTNTPSALIYLRDVGSPLVGMTLDLFHANIEEPDIAAAIHAGLTTVARARRRFQPARVGPGASRPPAHRRSAARHRVHRGRGPGDCPAGGNGGAGSRRAGVGRGPAHRAEHALTLDSRRDAKRRRHHGHI